MPRSRLGWNVVWFLALIVVIGSMCLVSRKFIGTPYIWLRPVSDISPIRRDAQAELFAVAEQRSKSSGNRSVRYGSRATGTNFQGLPQLQGPSQSVGIMCSYYGSTSEEIDIWLQILTAAGGGHVFMCDL